MKTCFKCGSVKQTSEFYTHPRMADGHLGKCKECTKRDTLDRVTVLKSSPDWIASERARCRNKQARYRRLGLSTPTSKEAAANWNRRNPHKKKAQTIANNAVRSGRLKVKRMCEDCGAIGRLHKHHEDYSKPLDVIFVCTKCHGRRHWKS